MKIILKLDISSGRMVSSVNCYTSIVETESDANFAWQTSLLGSPTGSVLVLIIFLSSAFRFDSSVIFCPISVKFVMLIEVDKRST